MAWSDECSQKLPSWQDYFELGVILLRKKLFTQATKNLEKAKKTWNGEPDELAQVGFTPSPLSCLSAALQADVAGVLYAAAHGSCISRRASLTELCTAVVNAVMPCNCFELK